MSSKQLNSNYVTYRTERTSEAFGRLYEFASTTFEPLHRESLRRGGCPDEHYAKETFDNAVFEIAERDDIVNFTNALSNALKRKRLMIFRTNKRRRRKICGSIDEMRMSESGEYIPKYEMPSEPSAEDVVFPSMNAKKEAEKRQLLDNLVDRTNDPVAKQIATKNRDFEGDKFSVNALAKALGIHHQVLDRKLLFLSRKYSPDTDGNIIEYFPEGKRVKREFLTA